MIKKIFRTILSKKLLYAISNFKNSGKSPEKLFTEIYEKEYWGKSDIGGKYYSGTGSSDIKTKLYTDFLIGFINQNKIKSIFEIGCGDFSIMKNVLAKTDVSYIGTDVVKNLIDDLNEKYLSNKIQFIHKDATSDDYDFADLCIIRQVLQHLNNQQIAVILEKTKQFKYVLITEHLPLNPIIKNGDKSMNGYIRLQNKKTSGIYLDEAPFNLKSKVVLTYNADDEGFDGGIIPAIIQTNLITNTIFKKVHFEG